MVAMYAERHRWELRDARVDVEYDPDSIPRRVAIEIRLPDSLSEDQIKRLERVAETCPLRRSLEAGFEFEERIVSSALSATA